MAMETALTVVRTWGKILMSILESKIFKDAVLLLSVFVIINRLTYTSYLNSKIKERDQVISSLHDDLSMMNELQAELWEGKLILEGTVGELTARYNAITKQINYAEDVPIEVVEPIDITDMYMLDSLLLRQGRGL